MSNGDNGDSKARTKKLLIVKTSSLGDVLHAFPAVHALCYAHGCKCDWVIEPQFADMLEYLPCVDRKIIFHKKEFENITKFIPTFLKFRADIRQDEYEAVLDFQGLMRNAILGWLAKYKRFVGFCEPKEILSKLLYTQTFNVLHHKSEEHAILKNNRMVMQFEHSLKLDFNYPLPVLKKYADQVRELPGCKPGQYVAIAPGARWESKEWPTEFFANTIRAIHKRYPLLDFVCVGANADVDKSYFIIKTLDPLLAKKVHNLCGRTNLPQLTELLRASAVCLTNDSGPMHIAAAAGTPVIALFGPTSPELTGPYTDKKVVLQPKLPCLKCFKRRCDNMACHREISAESVLKAMEKLLKNERN